jgi:hypothetical protein
LAAGTSGQFLKTLGAAANPIYDWPGLLGHFSNLIVKTNASHPTYQVDVTADSVVLSTAAGLYYEAKAVSVTADITGSGANGLDTGSEGASAWYYIWLIFNGTTVAALLSTSATAPTLPSGYTYKKRVGAVRNNGSSNFIAFKQTGKEVFVTGAPVALKSSGNDASWAAVDISAMIPSTCIQIFGTFGTKASGASECGIALGLDSSGNGAIYLVSYAAAGTTLDNWACASPFRLNLIATAIYYKKVTVATVDIDLNGWVDNI